MRNKTIPHSAFLVPRSELLFAAFCGCVGSAEADEQEGATADRSAGIRVLKEAVSRESREERVFPFSQHDRVFFRDFTVAEETALCESAKAQSENDCEC